jgi:hypothetical protein
MPQTKGIINVDIIIIMQNKSSAATIVPIMIATKV